MVLFNKLYVFSLLVIPISGDGCYNPDGSPVQGSLNYQWQPCIPVDGVSSGCCITNRTLAGVAPDQCAQNGLCMNFYTFIETNGKVFSFMVFLSHSV